METTYTPHIFSIHSFQWTLGCLHVYVYIHIERMEYYLAIKKNEIMIFAATWMDPEITILSEVSQKQKDKHCMMPLICGI